MLSFFELSAQNLGAADTSDSSVRKYQNIIKNNKQLVRFIEYTFTSKGIPKHMRNLAIIESHLDRNQVSVAGASGVWQFMSDHANEHGLTEADRSDMYKSTKTAANSLINLYNKYHNWITVVAAYNCGQGNINKAIQKAGSKKYSDFAQYLPSETQNHVQKYLNACYATGELNAVLEDYYKRPLNAKNVKSKETVDYEVFKANTIKNAAKINLIQTPINGGYDINVISKYLKIDTSEILKWNPDLANELVERGEGILHLPINLMDIFTINKYRILTDSLKQ